MSHCVLHDPQDSVAVVVVEGVKAGTPLTGLILDEDRTITLPCVQDIPLGHKVALCDQVEDARHAKGLVRREVVRIATPGTTADAHTVGAKENVFLAAVVRRGDRVVVRTKRGELLLMELTRRSAKRIDLKSLNARSPDRVLAAGDVAWIARIVWASQ